MGEGRWHFSDPPKGCSLIGKRRQRWLIWNMKTNRLKMLSCGAAFGILAACTIATPALAGGPSADQGTGYLYGENYPTVKTLREVNDLPQPVRSALKSEVGDKAIECIEQKTTAQGPVYKIQLSVHAPDHPTLWISADGTIVHQSHMEGIARTPGA